VRVFGEQRPDTPPCRRLRLLRPGRCRYGRTEGLSGCGDISEQVIPVSAENRRRLAVGGDDVGEVLEEDVPSACRVSGQVQSAPQLLKVTLSQSHQSLVRGTELRDLRRRSHEGVTPLELEW